MSKDYKETLNLPSTEFPMRANLADREPERIEWWKQQNIYDRMIEARKQQGAPRFILHDGPPYANGNIHHGHILNKTLKDFVVKYRNMAGYLCEYVPGWDCHGLPIEHKVEDRLGDDKHDLSLVEIRDECRQYASEYIDVQREEFKRVMVFGDWDNPYTTMSPEYEATILREIGRFFDEGLVYRGLKPVHWDYGSKTALAEAEVEYDTFKTEHVYVKFPFPDAPDWLADRADSSEINVLIWTTTPWTLPANLAIALNPELDYQLIDHQGDVFVAAKGRKEAIFEDCNIDERDTEVLTEFKGRQLVGDLGQRRDVFAEHPWLDRQSELLPAPYVTLEQGTGCVHTAPGHGQEDFELGRQYDLGVINPVDEAGLFIEEDLPEYGGMHVLTANGHIAEKLDDLGLLLNEPGQKVTIERYPYAERSGKPVLFRATTQWFIAMDEVPGDSDSGRTLRDRALEAIEGISWTPDWGEQRIRGMVESRPDWCISRQRYWGVPIPILYCSECDEALATSNVAETAADLVAEHGSDVWFEKPASTFAPEDISCPECGAETFEKEDDILDVWFDSGVSWSAVLQQLLGWGETADLYLEGSDQHRGWFQSSLLCGIGTRNHSPYLNCVTHGFVTDTEGHKYSKSSQNFEPPEEMISEYGAEILRLWVAAVDYRGDVMLSDEVLDRIADGYRKIRNTFRFMLGNLSDMDPGESGVTGYSALKRLDKWVLHRTAEVADEVIDAYKSHDFHRIYHTVLDFVTVDLSNRYMDIVKDRLYCYPSDSYQRKCVQSVFVHVTSVLARLLAPILSFTAEEVWSELAGKEFPESVFLSDMPTDLPDEWDNEDLADTWDVLFEVVDEVQRELEEHRASEEGADIGSSQEAVVTLRADSEMYAFLSNYQEQGTVRDQDDLRELFIVSDVELVEGSTPEDAPVACEVSKATKNKCPRCWNYWVEPDSSSDVCERCARVLDQLDQ